MDVLNLWLWHHNSTFEDPSISVPFVNWLRDAVLAKQQDALSKRKGWEISDDLLVWALLALLRRCSRNYFFCQSQSRLLAGVKEAGGLKKASFVSSKHGIYFKTSRFPKSSFTEGNLSHIHRLGSSRFIFSFFGRLFSTELLLPRRRWFQSSRLPGFRAQRCPEPQLFSDFVDFEKTLNIAPGPFVAGSNLRNQRFARFLFLSCGVGGTKLDALFISLFYSILEPAIYTGFSGPA